ncbi:MAG: cytochrome c biogenesis protein ResB [Desulfuromonadales bacterium]|nr:cytochrome c biogenesis protein ResB [Desulfuromonadales bacterium]MDT8424262.1 cytochrome c biogenesis protein ResB [Desulfuromonadales bacterium]
MANQKETTFAKKVADFFCSLKLTIFCLISLAVTSIIGTVIQQNKPRGEYVQVYGENLTNVFEKLQIIDMYHAWWFLGLLFLFCVNLISCSIKRLPQIITSVNNPPLTPDESYFKSLTGAKTFDSKLPPDQARERLSNLLGERFAKAKTTKADGTIHLFAQKMPWARFSVYVTHFSILLIFVGAIIGNIWGFKAYVNIVEGTSVDQVWKQGEKNPLKLGFEVRCDDFSVTFYEGGQRPKEFASVLDVIDNGQEVISNRKIVVNDPLSYKGITFYQSSYGSAGAATFKMRVTPKGGSGRIVTGQEGDHIPLPNGGSFAVNGYAAEYQGFGPAVQMHVNTPDGKHGNPFVVFQRHPEFDARRGGDYAFALLEYNELQYTGLQVKKDPGVWVVWTGCFLMIFGSMAAFMLAHRRIWIAIVARGNGCTVRFGGTTHRNRAAFDLYLDELTTEIESTLNAPAGEK